MIQISRREMLLASAGLVASMHLPTSSHAQNAQAAGKTLIKSVRLGASVDLEAMEKFYCGTLGFKKIGGTNTDLSIQAGSSSMVFYKAGSNSDDPLAHFAFNIPQNKIRQALEWSQRRIEVIPAWDNLADPNYPKEVVHFRHWNAHSLFFWDPGGNVVEFIARHDLDNDVPGDFSNKDVLNVSEIGLAVEDPVALAKYLQGEFSVPAYPPGTSPSFAMGDENGLLLCFKKGRQLGTYTKTPRHWQTNKTEVEISGETPRTVDVPGYPFTIHVKSSS